MGWIILLLMSILGHGGTAPVDLTMSVPNDTTTGTAVSEISEGFGKPAAGPKISDQELLDQMAYEQSLIDMYFRTMDAKPVPVYLCDDVESFAYRMPAPVSCPLLELDKPSKVVKLTFYYTNPDMATLTAYHCSSIMTYVRKSHFFFGAYSESTIETPMPVTASECLNMLRKNLSPKDDPMYRIEDNSFGTKLSTDLEYDWPKTKELFVQNYYFTKMTISARNEDQTIIAPLNFEEPCHLRQGYCPVSGRSMLIWQPTDVPTCRLTRGETSQCLYSDSDSGNGRISCMDIQMVITQIETSSICGMQMGISAQGLIYSQSSAGEVNSRLAVTSTVERAIHGDSAPPVMSKYESIFGTEFRFKRSFEHNQPKGQNQPVIPDYENDEDEEDLTPLHSKEAKKPRTTSAPVRETFKRPPPFVEDPEEEALFNPSSSPVNRVPVPTRRPAPVQLPDGTMKSVPIPVTTPAPIHLPTINPFHPTIRPLLPNVPVSRYPMPVVTTTMVPLVPTGNQRPSTAWQFPTISTTATSTTTQRFHEDLEEVAGVVPKIPYRRPLEDSHDVPPADEIDVFQDNDDSNPHSWNRGEKLMVSTRRPVNSLAEEVPFDFAHDKIHSNHFSEFDAEVERENKPQRGYIEQAHGPREQERANFYETPNLRVHTDAQINGKLEFLKDITQKDIRYAIQLSHLSTCIANQNMVNLLRALAETNMNALIHTVLPNHRYKATATGATVSVSRCHEIHNYVFLSPSPDNCTEEYPVEYMFRHEKRQGWMSGLSREILNSATQTECPNKNFYWDDGQHILLLNNRTKISARIPYLQLPSVNAPPADTVNIAFSSPGHIKTHKSEASDNAFSPSNLAKSSNRLEAILQAYTMGKTLTPNQDMISSTLRKFTLDPVYEIATMVGIGLLFVIIVGTIMTLCCCFRPTIWKVLKICCLCKRRRHSRRTIQRTPRFRNENSIEAGGNEAELQALAPPTNPESSSKRETQPCSLHNDRSMTHHDRTDCSRISNPNNDDEETLAMMIQPNCITYPCLNAMALDRSYDSEPAPAYPGMYPDISMASQLPIQPAYNPSEVHRIIEFRPSRNHTEQGNRLALNFHTTHSDANILGMYGLRPPM